MNPEQTPDNSADNQDKPEVQYSGAHPGDERDPKQLGDVLPEVLDSVEAAGNDEVTIARQRLADLIDVKNKGQQVSDEALEQARQALHDAQLKKPD